MMRGETRSDLVAGAANSAATSNDQIFLDFELRATWDRYNELKDRDFKNHEKLGKLLAFLIIYASAPFTLEAFNGSDFVRVWGVGGAWLAITVWFIADRDFRSYGYHLKERMFCLQQLAILRRVMTAANLEYQASTMFAVGDLRRNKGPGTSFPEKLKPATYTVACYFFKFLSLFPFLYLNLFLGFMLFPALMVSSVDLETGLLFLRLLVGFSALFYFWAWSSAERCITLQRLVFSARRISRDRGWSVYPSEGVGKERWAGRSVLVVTLRYLVICVSVLNLARGLYLVFHVEDVMNSWVKMDLWLAGISGILLLAILIFHEADIRNELQVAQRVDPLSEAQS